MTHAQELDLERFASLMVEMIERHSHVVDKEQMKKRVEDAEKSASSVVFWVIESYNKCMNSLPLSRKCRKGVLK